MKNLSSLGSAYAMTALATVLLLSSCATQRGNRSTQSRLVDCPQADVKLVPNPDNCAFDWEHKGAMDFLAYLQTSPEGVDGACFITCRRLGWIKRADVPKLIAQLDSERLCRMVLSSTMLWESHGETTVRYQALIMLESFRKGYYPAFVEGDRSFTERRNEFLKWWNEEKGQNPS